MKTKLIAILVAITVATQAMALDCVTQRDGLLFEKWMVGVRNVASHYGLQLDGNEGEDEFFYWECWRNADHNIVHAIRKAKRAGLNGGNPDSKRTKESNDYARFERWLYDLQKVAPRYGLKLNNDEADREFFWLYCWQSDDHSIVHCINQAKEVWAKPNG